jgi:DivIVA domain-containing protein
MNLLTSDDIRFKKFKTARLREGYNLDEVDEFLEEMIHTVDELYRRIDDLALNGGGISPANNGLDAFGAPIISNSNVSEMREEINNLKFELSKKEQQISEVDALRAQNSELMLKNESLENINQSLNSENYSDPNAFSGNGLAAELSQAREDLQIVNNKFEILKNEYKKAESLQTKYKQLLEEYRRITGAN